MKTPVSALASLVDLHCYPIDDATPARDNLIKSCREQLAHDGCCHLPGFLSPNGLAAFHDGAAFVAGSAHRSEEVVNPYFTDDDPTLASDHPKRYFAPRSNGFVPADCIDDGNALRALFSSDALTRFFADSLNVDPLYVYADPLADVIVNVVDPGDGFPWHFDTNDFSITVMIDPADSGGLFEYAPNIRSPGDENYEGVRKILDGDRQRVHSLDLRPGDLQIFKGRNSMHRVSTVEGSSQRRIAIYSYTREPGMVGKPKRMQQLYGKALPIHFEKAAAENRSDQLVD